MIISGMRELILLPLVGFLVAGAAGRTDAREEEEGVTSGKPTYRVLYNQDCLDFFDKGGSTPEEVRRMVDEVAAGGADVMLVNPNGQRVNYPSKVWQTFWDGYKEGDRSFFGDVPDNGVPRRENWVRNTARLGKQHDYLAIALARCREKGMTPGISLRMNDMHDQGVPNSNLHSRFYRDNPQFHLKSLSGRSGVTGLDYAHGEVRQHYLSLVRELAEGYDFDVIELDFMRFPYYFDREDMDRHGETMTGFIREVREVLDSTGRPISLIPRVAASPGAARQLGFDVQAWAGKGLVNGITAANFLTTCWDLAIGEFRRLVGSEVAVYAAAEVAADRRDGLPVRYLPESHEMLRGLATGYLASGADGINTFNFFLARRHRPVTAEEFYGGLREMRSIEEARAKPRIHLLNDGLWLAECDMPDQVPKLIRAAAEQRFGMFLAAEGEGQQVEALVTFDGESRAEDLSLGIGPHPAGHAVEIRSGPARKEGGESRIAVFNVPRGVITDGRNELIVRSERVDTTILGIDVCVR